MFYIRLRPSTAIGCGTKLTGAVTAHLAGVHVIAVSLAHALIRHEFQSGAEW
jgi:hypothetical protein